MTTQQSEATVIDRLVNAALAIETEAAIEAGALGFMARSMVQAIMLHRKSTANEFIPRNDAFTLSMLSPYAVSLAVAIRRTE